MLDNIPCRDDTFTMPNTNAFAELFERPGVLLPTLFSVIFVVSLFLVAAAGQDRLADSGEEIRAAEYRARRLAEFMRFMVDAETSVRGYVLTGDRRYLDPYREALPGIEAALADLNAAYRGLPIPDNALGNLDRLSEANLGLLAQVVDRRNNGLEPAALLIRSNVGQRTMDQLREVVDGLARAERDIADTVQARMQRDLEQGRWLLGLGALLNVLLVVLAGSLISRDLRRRAQLAVSLEDQRQALEKEVSERTQELEALSTHLQNLSEQERSALARELHDELGSLLVAARMDLSWLQRRLPTEDPNVKLRWQRIQDGLDAGVNLKRRVVEQLRPTLLDNMGLYAALRWQIQETCGRAGLKCTETYPDPEPQFTGAASIAIFRMVQEALTNVLKHARAQSVDFRMDVDETAQVFTIRITDDGVGIAPDRAVGTTGSHGLASMRHRIAAIGGKWEISRGAKGGTVLTARFPLNAVLLPAAESPEQVSAA